MFSQMFSIWNPLKKDRRDSAEEPQELCRPRKTSLCVPRGKVRRTRRRVVRLVLLAKYLVRV